MASFLNSVRQGFGRPANKSGNQKSGGSPSPSPTSFHPTSSLTAPRVPPVPTSPSLSSTLSQNDAYGGGENTMLPPSAPPPAPAPTPAPAMPLFLRDGMQIFIVKGNYMTLAAKPKSVDQGEWLAHHVVEQFRLLSQFITVIQSTFRKNGQIALICNPVDCPTMSAGTHTYTWLDSNRQPTRLPACQYITLVQKWISGKILDANLFPTDTTSVAAPATYASGGLNTPGATTPIAMGPTSLSAPLSQLGRDWVGKSSGFPENFVRDCKNIYKQMFRVYAHLYWAHFEHPFYHLDLERHFNSSFVHFVVVGTEFDLLSPKDLEPMQPLLDKWTSLKIFPSDSKIVAQAQAAAAAANNASTPSFLTPSLSATTLSTSTSSSFSGPSQSSSSIAPMQ
ncbi:MAG: hypothetical protein M1838_002899 [Thelocarpon superellum]|nr:MAG: hypothetical protein M1838_002899 [Thelocarpon superellum]